LRSTAAPLPSSSGIGRLHGAVRLRGIGGASAKGGVDDAHPSGSRQAAAGREATRASASLWMVW
jgi:hypothetical protein